MFIFAKLFQGRNKSAVALALLSAVTLSVISTSASALRATEGQVASACSANSGTFFSDADGFGCATNGGYIVCDTHGDCFGGRYARTYNPATNDPTSGRIARYQKVKEAKNALKALTQNRRVAGTRINPRAFRYMLR